MLRVIISSIFIFSVFSSFGQKEGFSIKGYQNTDIFNIQYHHGQNNGNEKLKKVNFNRISLAVNFNAKNNIAHEIEFLIPEVSKSFDDIQYPRNYRFAREAPDFEGQVSSYSLRYELSKTILTRVKSLSFNFGVAINPYYVLIEYSPIVNNSYYSASKLYGFVVNMVPRVKYRFSRRFSIDLNVPLKMYDLQAEKLEIKNPAIPVHQQTTVGYNNVFFESAFTIRLGVAYHLNNN